MGDKRKRFGLHEITADLLGACPENHPLFRADAERSDFRAFLHEDLKPPLRAHKLVRRLVGFTGRNCKVIYTRT